MTWLLDSVIVIDYLNGIAASRDWLLPRMGDVAVSVVTRAEVLAGLSDESDRTRALRLLDALPCFDVTPGDCGPRRRSPSRSPVEVAGRLAGGCRDASRPVARDAQHARLPSRAVRLRDGAVPSVSRWRAEARRDASASAEPGERARTAGTPCDEAATPPYTVAMSGDGPADASRIAGMPPG